MDDRGWNKADAGKALGVSPVTIGRWLKGRPPEAALLERISDVLVADFDFLASMTGYRPKELSLDVDPNSPEGQLVPLIRKIDWTDRDLVGIKSQLEFLANKQPRRQ